MTAKQRTAAPGTSPADHGGEEIPPGSTNLSPSENARSTTKGVGVGKFGVSRRELLGVGVGAAAVSAITTDKAAASPASDLVPIRPARVYDSRLDMTPDASGRIGGGANRAVSVANARSLDTGAVLAEVVPAAATAIAYTLTVAGTAGAGYLAVNPGGVTSVSASTINWTTDAANIANTGVVQVGANRTVTVVQGGGGTTDFLIDIVGYYLADVRSVDGAASGPYQPLAQVLSNTTASYTTEEKAKLTSLTPTPLITYAADPADLISGSIVRDANDAIVSADVVWPDGTPGRYVTTSMSSPFPGAIDAYTLSYGVPTVRTFVQSPVTRNANGAVTTRPPIMEV